VSTALKPIAAAKEFDMYFTVTHIEKAPTHSNAVFWVLFVELVNHSCFLRLLLLSGIETVAQKIFSRTFKFSSLTRNFLQLLHSAYVSHENCVSSSRA
jgi:hypothetical protein